MAWEATSEGRRPAGSAISLIGSAALALLLGTAVYLLDRDWSSVLFLAPLAAWRPAPSGVFGALGGQLPSFMHAYAFALLLIVALRPLPRARALGAAAWCSLGVTLECLQADNVRSLLAGTVGKIPDAPVVREIWAYIANGTLDIGDLSATVLGCVAAYAIATIVEVQS